MNKKTINFIVRCMLSDNRKTRTKYAKILIKHMNKVYDNVDDIISKLIQASKTIEKQNEWIECLQTAIGDNYEIFHSALVAQQVLNIHKKKRRKEE